jgi:hypothetical protein
MKKKTRFFAKHARSSAFLLTLLLHGGLLLGAVSFVAFRVLLPDKVEFRDIGFERPRLKPRRHYTPNLSNHRKPPRIQTKPVFIQTPNIRFANLTLPALPSAGSPMIGSSMGEDNGIACNFGANIDFYDCFEQRGEKVVFLVHAGPATTGGPGGVQTPLSRMTFHTLRKRLNEMVGQLPEYTLFNAAYYWQGHTSPMSPKMMLANRDNKQAMHDWGASMNPLETTDTYGSGFAEPFRKRLARLSWPEKLAENIPSFGPAWYHNYTCPPEVTRYYKGTRDGFENWARALCFAMEQKPDTIFILCTGYVIGHDAPEVMAGSYRKMAREIFGPDKRKYPTINVVVLNKTGGNPESAENNRARFEPIVSAFRGKSGVIENIRDLMSEQELAQFKALH